MTNRNRLTILTAGACLLGALTACTTPSPDAGHPETAPPSTATTTPTASAPTSPTTPATAPPTRPATANGLTLAAAEAFYRHYVDLMNYAAQTGDTTELTASSDSGCEGCKEYADFVARVNEANGGLSGDYRERVKEVSELSRGSTGRVGGSAVVTVGHYTTKESPTAKPIVSQATEYTEQIALASSGTNWIMYEIELGKR